jgi:hypothetical protein
MMEGCMLELTGIKGEHLVWIQDACRKAQFLQDWECTDKAETGRTNHESIIFTNRGAEGDRSM